MLEVLHVRLQSITEEQVRHTTIVDIKIQY